MARRPSLRAQIESLVETWTPEIRKAFMDGVNDLRSNADLRGIVAALERGDIEAAVRALNLDPAAFRQLDRAIVGAFESGGVTATAAISTAASNSGIRGVVFRFGVRNPRAEQWLSSHSSTMITRILDDQRTAVRNALRSGMEAGINPRTMALDITGRINRATGRREGGLIGLTAPQEAFSRNAMNELLSGDPALMRNYLTRGRRDKRFDRTVIAAIRDGVPIDRATAEKMVGRYRDNLLNLRGETIGRLEAKAALHQSEREAFLQAADTANVDRRDIKRTWRHSGGKDARDQHVAMNGQTVGVDEPFVAPDGTRLMFPCDPNAPVAHTANCRCQVDTTIDFLAALAREEAA